MEETRRSLLRKGSIASITGLGMVATASGRSQSVDDVHPDDKFTISKRRYRTGNGYRNLVEESPLYKTAVQGADVTIYIDGNYARDALDAVDTVNGETSVSKQIAESRQVKKRLRTDRERTEAIEEEIAESVRRAREARRDVETIDTIELGSDDTLYSNDSGDQGTDGFWGDKHAEAEVHHDQLHCEAIVAPTATSGPTAWAWVGDDFEVTGSGSQSCTIVPETYYSGTIWAAAGNESSVDVTFTLEDLDDGTVWEETLVDEEIASWITDDQDVVGTADEGVNVTLTAGHRYEARVRLEASLTAGSPTGGSSSDFGEHLDGNNLNNEYVDQKWYEFNF